MTPLRIIILVHHLENYYVLIALGIRGLKCVERFTNVAQMPLSYSFVAR